MTHKQIWLEAAEAFLTPLKQRTERQSVLTEFGLCRIVYISKTLQYDCRSFEHFAIPNTNNVNRFYWLPTVDDSQHKIKHDELRGLASLFFATMTLKEFKQLLIEPEG